MTYCVSILLTPSPTSNTPLATFNTPPPPIITTMLPSTHHYHPSILLTSLSTFCDFTITDFHHHQSPTLHHRPSPCHCCRLDDSPSWSHVHHVYHCFSVELSSIDWSSSGVSPRVQTIIASVLSSIALIDHQVTCRHVFRVSLLLC